MLGGRLKTHNARKKPLALSIVNTTAAHPAHLGFNTAPPSLGGSQPSAGPGNGAAGDTVTTAIATSDAVKPAPRLAGAGAAASVLDARASVRFATNPVSTGPAAASASDYAKAIAAYTRQSTVGVAAPSSTAVPSGDAAEGAAIQAANPHVNPASGGARVHQPNVPPAAGSNPQATAPSASSGVAANDNTDAAAPKADATPPAASLEAGGQAHPIAAPTAHAVLSLLKMI
jgi:hypothetical protein